MLYEVITPDFLGVRIAVDGFCMLDYRLQQFLFAIRRECDAAFDIARMFATVNKLASHDGSPLADVSRFSVTNMTVAQKADRCGNIIARNSSVTSAAVQISAAGRVEGCARLPVV